MDVPGNENVSRFILFSRWFRKSDQTIRPDAFIPYPYPNLSVTRHRGITEKRIWELGKNVADLRERKLYGRTDLQAVVCISRGLILKDAPPPDNHVNISDWPSEKSAQKMIAIEIAKLSSKLIPFEASASQADT